MPRRAIQRERKSTTNNASEEANQMVNTQIVKVIVQHPKKKVVNRKPKTEKRDSKKKLAIEKLKKTLELFREVKERALQAKITIPASIGEMPSGIENTKKVEDIESLTNTLMMRIREIEELIRKKQEVPRFFGMPEREGSFPSGYAHEFRNVMSGAGVPFYPHLPLVNPTVTPVQIPPTSITDPALEAKLKSIEQGLEPVNQQDKQVVVNAEKERQLNIQNITQAFNTKKQAIGMTLAAGKISQKEFDKQIADATKVYNDQLNKNNAEAAEKLRDLKEKTTGLDTQQEWKTISEAGNTIRGKIRGSNSIGSINEKEVVDLEARHRELKILFDEFERKHRDDIEQHQDLLPRFNGVKTLVNSTVRNLIKVPIKDTESIDDKVNDAKKRLEEVNQMYVQLKEDVGNGIGDNAQDIKKKIIDIEKYHEQVKAINLKEGIPPTHSGLKSIEAIMSIDKQDLLDRHPDPPPQPPPPSINAPREKLTAYVKNQEGYKKWNAALTQALTDMGWNGYYYKKRKDKKAKSQAVYEVSRDLKVSLLNALLAGQPTPKNWYKEF